MKKLTDFPFKTIETRSVPFDALPKYHELTDEELRTLKAFVPDLDVVETPGYFDYIPAQAIVKLKIALHQKRKIPYGDMPVLTWLDVLTILQVPQDDKRNRRAVHSKTEKPLTTQQVRAVHLYGEHKGNVSHAAKTMGISAKTFRQHLVCAEKKMGRKVVARGSKTRNLPIDKRGQVNIPDSDKTKE